MMKSSVVIAVLLLSFLGNAQIDDYTYSRKISGIENEWHIVELPDDFFSKVRPAFADLRFFGITAEQDTIEAPYQVRHRNTEIKTSDIAYQFVDLVKTSRGFEYTFLFEKPEAINQINLSFSEANYDWEITVEGSNNGQNWNTVVEDYRLLKIRNQYTDYAFDRIDFNEVKYKHVRITVPLSANPVVISPRMIKKTVIEGKKKNYPARNIVVKQDKTKKQTIIDFELAHSVPVSDVTVEMNERFDFYRPIEISYLFDSIQTEKGVKYNYRAIYRGILSSLEKNQFDCSNTTAKKFRIVIDNNDNQPLNLNKLIVNGYVYEAIVRFNESANYFMVYGNETVYSPKYDIAYFMDRVPENLTSVQLGNEVLSGISSNKKNVSEPFFQSNGWLYGIMGMVVLLLGWFTLKMMKKEPE